MISSLIKGSIIGGIVLFLWGAISWMLIPWHQQTIHQFHDEAAVTQTLKANAPITGVYMLPHSYEEHEVKPDFFFFGSVKISTPESMNYKLLVSFIIQCIVAFVLSFILLSSHIRDYAGKVTLITLVGLAAGIYCYLPLWNWFEFSPLFTLVEVIDKTVGAFLVGLVLPYIVKK